MIDKILLREKAEFKQQLTEAAGHVVEATISEMRDLPDNSGFGLTRAQVEVLLNTWQRHDLPPESYSIPEPRSVEGILRARLHPEPPAPAGEPPHGPEEVKTARQPVRPAGLMPYNLEMPPINLKQAILQAYFDESVSEEQIDELSKTTLGSYIKKTTDNVAANAAQGMATSPFVVGSKTGSTDTSNKHFAKVDKRKAGIATAVKKLTEEQIDELSKATLGSYVKKASASMYKLGKAEVTQDHKTHTAQRVAHDAEPEVKDAAYSAYHSAQRKGEKIAGKTFTRNDGIRRAVKKLTEADLQELSKATLSGYISKASKSAVGLGRTIGHFTTDRSSDPEPLNTARRQVRNRMKGIDQAVKKLTESQLDELSKATLGSYIKKASDKKAVAAAGIVTSTAPHQSVNQEYHAKNFIKRSDGITRAVKKLTEADLQELSKTTLGSYIKKASVSAANNAHSAGKADEKGNRKEMRHYHGEARGRIKGIAKAVDKLSK